MIIYNDSICVACGEYTSDGHLCPACQKESQRTKENSDVMSEGD